MLVALLASLSWLGSAGAMPWFRFRQPPNHERPPLAQPERLRVQPERLWTLGAVHVSSLVKLRIVPQGFEPMYVYRAQWDGLLYVVDPMTALHQLDALSRGAGLHVLHGPRPAWLRDDDGSLTRQKLLHTPLTSEEFASGGKKFTVESSGPATLGALVEVLVADR